VWVKFPGGGILGAKAAISACDILSHARVSRRAYISGSFALSAFPHCVFCNPLFLPPTARFDEAVGGFEFRAGGAFCGSFRAADDFAAVSSGACSLSYRGAIVGSGASIPATPAIGYHTGAGA
jgi:hypothetical protein